MTIVAPPRPSVSTTADFLAGLVPDGFRAVPAYAGPRPEFGSDFSPVAKRYVGGYYVYAFLRDGWPIYVGMTCTPVDRFSAHRRKDWFPVSNEFALVGLRSNEQPDVKSYAAIMESSRAAQMAASLVELRAIRTLRPSHNVAGMVA